MAQHNIGHFEKIRALASGARALVVGGLRAGAGSQVTFYDAVSHKRLAAADLPAHALGAAVAGELAAVACSDGAVRVYKIATGELTRQIAAHQGAATAVAFGPDGNRVASAGADGWLRVHSATSGEVSGQWQLSGVPLRAVAVDPTGEYAAGAGDDGVVRVVTLATRAIREMPGHDGAVRSLAFTPRDGRLVSGGDDGQLRIWFLVGDVESEVRGGSDAHEGPVLALAFVPPPKKEKEAPEQGDRFFSAGEDGLVKLWRLGDRRRPRTFDAQEGHPIGAIAFLPHGRGEQLGILHAGGDRRVVSTITLRTDGETDEASRAYEDGFEPLREALSSGAKPAREGAVKALAALDEPEALEMLTGALGGDRYAEVRELAARELARHGRVKARAALREALNDAHAGPRAAAYEALSALDSPLAAARAGIDGKHPDIRARALADLATHQKLSPLVGGLIAGKLDDESHAVRLAALDAYERLFEKNSPEPLRAAYERGPAELKIEALVRAALGGALRAPLFEPIVTRAFDDENVGVRRAAFALKALERPALVAALEKRDKDLDTAVSEVCTHAARALAGPEQRGNTKAPGDEALQQARARLLGAGPAGGALTEEDLLPLLTAMACRTPDTALRGARGLAELGDTRALGALLQLSREADKLIRRDAAVALRSLEDPRAKRRLAWMLDDADGDVRAAALDAYGKLEADPLALAEASLRSSQKDIRVRGLSMLVKLGNARTAETDALLGDALEDESPDVRGEAFRTLWSWHSKEPQKAIDRALEARFADLRLRAVQELDALGKEAWAADRLLAAIGDRDSAVAMAAYEATVKHRGKSDPGAHLAAMGSTHPAVRAAGAKGTKGVGEAARGALMKQLADEHPEPRAEALSALDKLFPRENGPLYAGLQSSFYDLKVQAAKLLAERHDEQLIDTVRTFLSDKELSKTIAAGTLADLRRRAAEALATLASPRALSYCATELLKDADGFVQEQGARALANASRKGDEGYLLDALGHTSIAVRSWAAEGLARLGDARALPVLTGTLRHEHPPIRVGAILSFASLGPEGYGGMLQGLEDSAREVQELVFIVILARDLRSFRAGEPPDLLTSALSSQRHEVRFAAARALELRTTPEQYLAHLVELLLPHKPDKASAMKDWPAEQERARLMVGLAEGLASDRPDVRYAAAQALRRRNRPTDYFKEAESVGKLRPAGAPVIPDTTPKAATEDDTPWGASGWLRKLFRRGDGAQANDAVPDAEQRRLRWLAFGAYVGLLRQVDGDDEGHHVRRDSIERIVELTQQGHMSTTAALPPLSRALDDPNYLVRRAAFGGLKKLFPEGADEPLVMALASRSEDVCKLALDELTARGEAGKTAVSRALNSPVVGVRKYAFDQLEKLCPKGSLEPLLRALESDHTDLRIGVIERLATAQDERVSAALIKALESEHDDLRLRAAELLVQRKNDQAADALGAFLRAEEDDDFNRACEALARLGTAAAVAAIAARLDDATEERKRAMFDALGRTRNAAAVDVLIARFAEDDEDTRQQAFRAAIAVAGKDPKRRDVRLALRALRAAAQARDPWLRLAAAEDLAHGDEVGQNETLVSLFLDRDKDTRTGAVASYSTRVIEKNAPAAPLEEVLRRGARELMLAAAEGVAHKAGSAALRPLLLFARAGEEGERERALLALGTLGDPRALAELEQVASGGTEEAPVEPSMQWAAVEALGRIYNKLTDAEARQRLLDRLEQGLVAEKDAAQEASLRGLYWIGGERCRVKIEATLLDQNTRWDQRQLAAELLGKLKDPASELPLARALNDSDSDVREAALAALHKLFPKERTRVEFHALLSDSTDISEPASTFLAEKGDADVLLGKLGELREPSLQQQLRLGLLRRPRLAAAPLAKLLAADALAAWSNAAWLIGARASGAPGAFSDEDKALLQGALRAAEAKLAARWPRETETRDEVRQAWERVLWATRMLGDKAALERLRAIAVAPPREAPASARHEAVCGLGALGTGADVAALTAALRDEDERVRAAASAGLRALAPDRATALALAAQPFDPTAFAAALGKPSAELLGTDAGRKLALARAVTEAPDALAARLATAKDADLLDAIAAAGRGGGHKAIAALEAIAIDKKNHDAAARKAAYRALKRAKRAAAKAHQETRA